MRYDTPHPAFTHPVLARMWSSKGTFRYVFAHARTTRPITVREGHDDCAVTERVIPAGTRVLCTMVSRFGDVGIRARDVDIVCHGYDMRVPPEWLDEIVETV